MHVYYIPKILDWLPSFVHLTGKVGDTLPLPYHLDISHGLSIIIAKRWCMFWSYARTATYVPSDSTFIQSDCMPARVLHVHSHTNVGVSIVMILTLVVLEGRAYMGGSGLLLSITQWIMTPLHWKMQKYSETVRRCLYCVLIIHTFSFKNPKKPPILGPKFCRVLKSTDFEGLRGLAIFRQTAFAGRWQVLKYAILVILSRFLKSYIMGVWGWGIVQDRRAPEEVLWSCGCTLLPTIVFHGSNHFLPAAKLAHMINANQVSPSSAWAAGGRGVGGYNILNQYILFTHLHDRLW